ncbi:MAG: carbon-nitrogen hydrolase family protein [Calditrichaeota bacterium]|nr:MAG: carbon-nitrogen hydrolase family protein [Calditrichota bacterium]
MIPEPARTLALKGARLIVYASAVPAGFHGIHRLRMQSRALDNQLFVLSYNQAAPPFCGGSLIADPTGTVLQEAGEQEALLVQHLDLTRVDRWRQQEKIFSYRRPGLYRV